MMYSSNEDNLTLVDIVNDIIPVPNSELLKYDEEEWEDMITDHAATAYAMICDEIEDKLKAEDEYAVHFLCGVIKSLDLFSALLMETIREINEEIDMSYKKEDEVLT